MFELCAHMHVWIFDQFGLMASFLTGNSNPYATPLFLHPREPSQQPSRRRELTKEELEEIAYAFTTMDSEKTGFVDARQLKVSSELGLALVAHMERAQVALRAMGFPVKKADVREMLKRHTDEGQEKLDYEIFRHVVSDKLSERTPQASNPASACTCCDACDRALFCESHVSLCS